jgi:ADP-ribosylglycohydrolase
MGMPASFMSPEQIRKVYGKINDFVTPSGEQVAHKDVQEGEITDDTQESLIISSTLIDAGCFDTQLFVSKMKQWAEEYHMLQSTVIGPSTRRFLETIIQGGDYMDAGKHGKTNGAAMRVAPVGIFHHGNIEKAIEDAISSARPSHGSKPGIASACAIAVAVSVAVTGESTAEQVILAAIYGAEKGESAGFEQPSPSVAARIRLAKEIVDRNRNKSLDDICYILYQYIGAGMESYESIPLSLGVFYAANGDVSQGIIAAINIGDDADTNGAIVGSLCGAFSGASSIPPAWIQKIEETNAVDFKKIAAQLLEKSPSPRG